jgi:hypothetical protein
MVNVKIPKVLCKSISRTHLQLRGSLCPKSQVMIKNRGQQTLAHGPDLVACQRRMVFTFLKDFKNKKQNKNQMHSYM